MNLNVKNSIIKRIVVDFGLSITASAISIIGLQIFVYPAIAKMFGGEVYGEFLTIIAIVNIIMAVFGNPLNNTRLIQNNEYQKNNENGDFNLLLCASGVVALIAIIVIGNCIFNFDVIDNIFVSVCVVLGVVNAYINVGLRLKLNYRMLIVSSIARFCGYMLGIFIAYKTGRWFFAFIFGELFDFILLSYITKLLKEPYRKTSLFKKTAMKYGVLISTGLLANVSVYLDRFIIYPFLGSESVSTYTVASFFGKGLGLVMMPISGVLLSYYAQKNFNMNSRKFWSSNIFFLLLSLVFFVFSLFCSPWVTGLLYPTLIDSAVPYIMLANLAAIINVLANMVTPMILRYSNISWQVIIQVSYLIAYFGLGYLLLSTNGLVGFCIASIIANSIKVFLLYFAGAITFSRKKSNDKKLGDENV